MLQRCKYLLRLHLSKVRRFSSTFLRVVLFLFILIRYGRCLSLFPAPILNIVLQFFVKVKCVSTDKRKEVPRTVPGSVTEIRQVEDPSPTLGLVKPPRYRVDACNDVGSRIRRYAYDFSNVPLVGRLFFMPRRLNDGDIKVR